MAHFTSAVYSHHSTPVLYSALQGSQLCIAESFRLGCTQPYQQVLGRRVRVHLEPEQHVGPDALERILQAITWRDRRDQPLHLQV